jgi:alkaline phosphatase
MNLYHRLFLLPLFFVLPASVASAQGKYIHSHNDYNQQIPFYKAFYDGFNSIEADIFLVDKKLLVAHEAKTLRPERTLKGMYFDPALYALRKDTSRRLCLLIDVKEDYQKLLPELVRELKPLSAFLMSPGHPGRLKILVSGNRPMPAAYKNYPDFLFFDDDLIYPHTKAEWARVGQVSLNFDHWSKWKGRGPLPGEDKKRIEYTIDSVHQNTGKLVRFWGAPDSPDSWQTQIDFGADIIGTDMIDQLQAFLTKKALCQPTTVLIPVSLNNK